MRKMLQAILCILLCPLLVAQQFPAATVTSDAPQTLVPDPVSTASGSVPEFVAIPKGTRIELILLDPVSSAECRRRSGIHFAVWKDVVVDGITAIPAGTLVAGTVTRAKQAIPNKRDGSLDFRPKDVEVTQHRKLRLTNSPPRPPKSWAYRRDQVDQTLRMIVTAPLWLPRLPFDLAGWKQEGRNEHPQPPRGKDVEFHACYVEHYWFTRAAVTIRVAALPAAAPARGAYCKCMSSPN